MASVALGSPGAVRRQATYSGFGMGRRNDSGPWNGCLAASVPAGGFMRKIGCIGVSL
mgnify:CR=1 FL=1